MVNTNICGLLRKMYDKLDCFGIKGVLLDFYGALISYNKSL